MAGITDYETRYAHEQAAWPERARAVVLVGAVLVVTLCLVVIAGWYLRSDRMIRLGVPDTIPMRMNTAVWLLAVPIAVATRQRGVRWALAGLVLVTAGLTILEYRLSVDFGIDELLVEDWATPDLLVAGRPSETTALALILLGVSVLLLDLGRHMLAQACALAPLAVGMLTIYGYAFGSEALYTLGPYSAVAFDTGVVLSLTSLVALVAVPGGVVQWIVFGADPGARIQRWLSPTALVAVPVVAFLIQEGEQRGEYDVAMALALVVAFVATLLVVIGFQIGRDARRTDRNRNELLDELRRVNDQLEDRVRSRSHQLNRQRTKLALFEERDRIARDLHDRVIQRIFAAGLQVASLSRTAHKEAAARGEDDSVVADNLHVVATELDLAIRELRNSIFELTSIGDHDNVEQVVRDVASRASRILGYMPRIEVTGQVAGVPGEIVAQLASVMQEGLSNVARHAQASAVEVAVHATGSHLQVRITDDGVGLPDPLPRSSGISNLMNRARSLGGSATWANGSPTGTVLVWRVPLPGAADHPDTLGQGNETPVAPSDSDHSPAASSRS